MITGRQESFLFERSHIWTAGHRMGTGLLVITIYKIPYYTFIIKMLYQVYGVLKIVEDRFYFRGIILLTCPKKRDNKHEGFHGKSSNFHYVVKYIQICEIY